MIVLHVVPKSSNFYSYVRKRSADAGHYVVDINDRFPLIIESAFYIISLILIIFSRKSSSKFVVFHSVNNIIVLVTRILLFDRAKYGFIYWGHDFYRDIVSEDYIESQCLSRSGELYDSIIASNSFAPKIQSIGGAKTIVKSLAAPFKRKIVLFNLQNCSAILGLSEFQYEILAAFFKKNVGFSLPPEHKQLEYYDSDKQLKYFQSPIQSVINNKFSVNESVTAYKSRCLRVLICHSATRAVNHFLSLSLLEKYCQKWSIPIHIGGYLSYSGGDYIYRRNLAEELRNRSSSFCADNSFFAEYLSFDDLIQSLSFFDIAVFSCMRDKGVTLLRSFAQLGGLLCFNQYSVNYDFFTRRYPLGTFSHQEFCTLSPEKLISLRATAKTFVDPPVLTYEELASKAT